MSLLKKLGIFSVFAAVFAAPGAGFADNATDGMTVTSKLYVDNVVGAKQDKPASGFAEGKVLTYSGNTAANPTASYVKVPVATADPSASSNPGTVSNLASIWIQ